MKQAIKELAALIALPILSGVALLSLASVLLGSPLAVVPFLIALAGIGAIWN